MVTAYLIADLSVLLSNRRSCSNANDFKLIKNRPKGTIRTEVNSIKNANSVFLISQGWENNCFREWFNGVIRMADCWHNKVAVLYFFIVESNWNIWYARINDKRR